VGIVTTYEEEREAIRAVVDSPPPVEHCEDINILDAWADAVLVDLVEERRPERSRDGP
jgi:hypothetical protein